MREAQLGGAGSVWLVTAPVLGLLDRRRVGDASVCLDDEAEGWKPEVDLKPLTQAWLSGTGKPAAVAIGMKRSSRSVCVITKVWR